MYARDVDGKTVTLGVSGLLWNRSLVMYDRETGSLWSHILGQAMQGPLTGKELKQVPSVMTDWQSWQKQHPSSTVAALSRTSNEYRREFYRKPEQFVLGIVDDERTKAWGFDLLRRNPVLNDSIGERPVLIAFGKENVAARMYDRRLNGQVLTFRAKDGKLVDNETQSTWSPLTGEATTGPLSGKYLTALPAIISYAHVWRRFHPESETGGAK